MSFKELLKVPAHVYAHSLVGFSSTWLFLKSFSKDVGFKIDSNYSFDFLNSFFQENLAGSHMSFFCGNKHFGSRIFYANDPNYQWRKGRVLSSHTFFVRKVLQRRFTLPWLSAHIGLKFKYSFLVRFQKLDILNSLRKKLRFGYDAKKHNGLITSGEFNLWSWYPGQRCVPRTHKSNSQNTTKF